MIGMYVCILGIDDVSCSRNEIPESLLALFKKTFFLCKWSAGWVGGEGGGMGHLSGSIFFQSKSKSDPEYSHDGMVVDVVAMWRRSCVFKAVCCFLELSRWCSFEGLGWWGGEGNLALVIDGRCEVSSW